MILERNGKDSLHPKPYPKKYLKLSSLVCWRRPGILKVRTKLPQFGGLEIHHPDVHLHLSSIELRSGFESEKKTWAFLDTTPQKKSKNHQKKIFSIHPMFNHFLLDLCCLFLVGWWCVPPVNNPNFRINKQTSPKTGSKDPMPGWLIGAVPPVQFFAWYLGASSKGYEKGPGLNGSFSCRICIYIYSISIETVMIRWFNSWPFYSRSLEAPTT